MTRSEMNRCWALVIIGGLGLLQLIGCSRTEVEPADHPSSSQVKAEEPKTTPGTVVHAGAVTPFADAVRLDPPDGEQRPPDATVNGKVPGKIFEQIGARGGLWEQVRFVASDGKRIQHHALVRTDAGDFKIELLQDAAPHHVRSFICLARAGYFDGLPFHASIRREGKNGLQGYLETGCPKGTGEIGYGSIGYWLKPEVKADLHHEEGSVGAWHPQDIDRAACRFYITLNKAPAFDGNYTIFGKVVEGLDVVHTMNKRPIQDDEYNGPPQTPYRIREIVIRETREGSRLVAENR